MWFRYYIYNILLNVMHIYIVTLIRDIFLTAMNT